MDSIIIITSDDTTKTDRFISGSEWVNGWGFGNNKPFIVRKNEELLCHKTTNSLTNEFSCSKAELIVWINGEKVKNDNGFENIKAFLETVVVQFVDIRIAYHDEKIEELLPAKCKKKKYSLGKGNENQFNQILSNNKFKTSAPFSDFKKVFFENPVEVFSFLKHKIAHLFLSIDMDLQGIAEVKMREKKNKSILNGKGSKDYLKEVLEDKKDETYYTKLLGDLQFMIAGCKLDKKVTKNIKDDYLPEKKSVLDLIDDKKDTIKEKKGELMKLCGLVEKDGGISSNKDSIICKFMEMMGKKASKNEIDNKDVNDILEFFKKAEIKQGINSFHDWFCALDNCLEKIRESVK